MTEIRWTAQEQEAIDQAASVNLDSPRARQIRAFLIERFGADMVTDELVAVTVAAE